MSAKDSLVGKTIANWFVFADAPSRIYLHGSQRRSWARCRCGREKIVINDCLIRGTSKSCGKCKAIPHHNLRHGCSNTRIYQVWCGMIARCENRNHPEFKNWGGRGIKICPRWRNSFEHFLEDMGIGKRGWSIERIDNNRGYGLYNVVWATAKQQTRNYRRNVIITVRGITGCIIDLCEKFRIPYKRTWKRIRKLGWTPDEAFSKP